MIKRLLLLAGLLAWLPAFAQKPSSVLPPAPELPAQPGAVSFNDRLNKIMRDAGISKPPGSEIVLTKFTLDFPGGTPKQLVVAIEKAMNRPLNAIIPPEHADLKLPPLKMSNVDVRQLFQALELTSQKTETYPNAVTFSGGSTAYSALQQMRTGYGFRTQGEVSDESIWYFYVEKPTLPAVQVRTPQKLCRYFALAPYLERGQTVDDITTAIQTGWKMLGDDDAPKLSFHQETKLLIAVGEPEKLAIIDDVLRALNSAPAPALVPAPRLPAGPPRALPERALKEPPSTPAPKP